MTKKKRMNRLAQLAMEYVIIFAFIMMVIIPTTYVLKNYIADSIDSMTIKQAERITRVLIDNAREMYYLGTPSKIVVTVDMPNSIERMWIIDNKHDQSNLPQEYIIAYRINTADGEKDFLFDSDIPIQCWQDSSQICEEFTADIDNDGLNDLNDQCRVDNAESDFRCFEFSERERSSGIKRFKLEAIDNCWINEDKNEDINCVRIDEITDRI